MSDFYGNDRMYAELAAEIDEDKAIEESMNDHGKHYRSVCRWVSNEVKRRGRYHKSPEWAVLKELFGNGSTVSEALWNKYKPE